MVILKVNGVTRKAVRPPRRFPALGNAHQERNPVSQLRQKAIAPLCISVSLWSKLTPLARLKSLLQNEYLCVFVVKIYTACKTKVLTTNGMLTGWMPAPETLD
jgi:hypothetical protein